MQVIPLGRRDALRHALKRSLLIGLVLLLAALCSALSGCLFAAGSGADDEPDQPTPGVDCKAHPEQCQ